MRNKYLFTAIFWLLLGLDVITAQPLKERLDALAQEYPFSYTPLETNEVFSEKYLISFKQPVDHHGAIADTFTQRVFISHRDFNNPVVFITEGYDANPAVNKDFQYELTYALNANQVCVEHRYFGDSKPDSLAWEFLTTENAANDHHRIAEFIKKIYATKLISTGISKGGQTTNFFKYYFPEDADICVSYVAPVAFSSEDKRVYSFLKQVGTEECRKQIKAYQMAMFKNKKEFLGVFTKEANKPQLTYDMGYSKAYDLLVFEYPFAFWQWGKTPCEQIPDSNSSAAEMVKHLDQVAGFDWVSNEGIEQMQPFFYQAMRQIGMYGYDIEPFKAYTDYTSNVDFVFTLPSGIEVAFEPEFMQKVDIFLRHYANNMIFIYGEYDPWSATALEPGGQTNTFKVVKKGGSHRTRIANLPEQQQKQVLDSLNTWLLQPNSQLKNTTMEQKKKVIGVGGIFFKSTDPKALNEWYGKNLGLVTNEYGSLFEFRSSDQPDQKGYLQWSPFGEKTTYFQPSEKDFMINYRVENLEELVTELKKNGVNVLDEIETYEYGKFVHIMDPDGNKIELWEPVDTVFTKMYEGMTTK